MDLFAAIADERRNLADVLAELTDEQWTSPSCCDGWTIEDVAAHLTVVWNYSALDYLRASMKNRATWFHPRDSLAAINQQTVEERRATGRAAIVSEIRAHADDRSTPTGFGPSAPLTDVVVHAADIAIPLGRALTGDPLHARPALDAATSPRFALFSRRSTLRDLSFRATDIEWRGGAGPEVAGPARSLAHAMWGRPASLAALSGPGVDRLRAASG